MYNLPYHKETEPSIVKDFVRKNPFAFLTACDAENNAVATQLPLLLEEQNGKEVLIGHIMKGTDHHKAFVDNQVLAVFSGKHTYVSGRWYSNPNTPSTWNYMSVHIKGKLRLVDKASLKEVLQKTSLHFEDQNEQSPTVFHNLPSAFKKKALDMIVGFEIQIQEKDTVFKLSQDRNQQSYRNIIAKLKSQDESGRIVAAEMEKRESRLFS